MRNQLHNPTAVSNVSDLLWTFPERWKAGLRPYIQHRSRRLRSEDSWRPDSLEAVFKGRVVFKFTSQRPSEAHP